jgi:hypothetical protein
MVCIYYENSITAEVNAYNKAIKNCPQKDVGWTRKKRSPFIATLCVNNMTIYFSSECPIGCGELMFVQSKLDEKVFCYCTGCGIGFDHPSEIQVDSKLDMSKTLASFAPEGIVLPTKEAIESSGFGAWITEIATDNEWHSAQDINEDLRK